MRIGTWNLDNRVLKAEHLSLIQKQQCDVWLLTEFNPRWKILQNIFEGYHCHVSQGVMCRKQYWAAILSLSSFKPLPDPHPASAAAVIGEVVYCSSILPWAGCTKYEPHPWKTGRMGELTGTAIECLRSSLTQRPLVWGGDWNQNLEGGWQNVGSKGGRAAIESAVDHFRLRVDTRNFPNRLGSGRHTIDHIAVPKTWEKRSATPVVAVSKEKRLSDHDAYVVDVEPS